MITMGIHISKKITSLEGSLTAQFFAKAKKLEKQGKSIIHLEIGQPDFLPPKDVLKATQEAIQKGYTAYTISNGIPELREAIKDHLTKARSLSIDHDKNVIITSGAKQAIFGALLSIIEPHDKVLIPDPGWVSYADIIRTVDGVPEYYPHLSNFHLDQEALLEKIREKPRAIIINSPSNPTGAIYTPEELKFLRDLALDHNIAVISDEIYSDYIYDNFKHTSVLDLDSWEDFGVLIHGFSKSFSMTGYRLGYVVANENVITGIKKVIQNTTSCPTSFAQYAALAALKHYKKALSYIAGMFPQRRQYTLDRIKKLRTFAAFPPEGAFYVFVKHTYEMPSIELAELILKEVGVAVMPGSAFGPNGEKYLRIAYSRSLHELEEAFDRLEMFEEKYNKN